MSLSLVSLPFLLGKSWAMFSQGNRGQEDRRQGGCVPWRIWCQRLWLGHIYFSARGPKEEDAIITDKKANVIDKSKSKTSSRLVGISSVAAIKRGRMSRRETDVTTTKKDMTVAGTEN